MVWLVLKPDPTGDKTGRMILCLLEGEVRLVAGPDEGAHGDGQGEGALQHAAQVQLQAAAAAGGGGQEQLHSWRHQVGQQQLNRRHSLLACTRVRNGSELLKVDRNEKLGGYESAVCPTRMLEGEWERGAERVEAGQLEHGGGVHVLQAGLAIKNPPKKTTQKNPKKTTWKNHLKKPTKNVFFLVFLKFLFFYVNNTNFSHWNRFLMNK